MAAVAVAAGGASAMQTQAPRVASSAAPRFALVSLSLSRQAASTFGNAFPSSSPRLRESLRRQQRSAVLVRAQADDGSSELTEQAEKLWKDLQVKWEGVEDKTTVVVYAGGAVFGLWLLSSVASAVNSVPLLPKLLELIGLGYTSWFVYRYLLFKDTRQELLNEIEDLKAKVTGAYENQSMASTVETVIEMEKDKEEIAA
eukprot:TRINITY_DN2653_c0_g2_i1.p1 TRINITY_DN2653_c0_g2~~TRINITY_DN2653_c0_g2_i1.p1  ORF type:complete len:223 (+),score=60.93 TRINITY_DN2653_c0_g2_i1:70-669(+)